MSQHKEETMIEETNSRIQTRRTSRSTRSASPVIDEEVSSPVSSVELNSSQVTNVITNGGRVTRSQSVESSGYETTDSRKRKRKAKSNGNNNNKKRGGGDLYSKATPPPSTTSTTAATVVPSSANSMSNSNGNNNNNLNQEGERETRNTAQRISKEAREAKKAQRDLIIKERLSELDKLEKAVKDGSHSEYHKLLSDIEMKRTKMLNVAEMRRSLAEGNVNNFFNSQKYAAYSQYYWDKLALRRSMIQHVQHKINTLEQEYYSNHVQSSLDDEHLCDWVPPDRPSMISSLTLGLSEEDAENDVEWAKQDPTEDPSTYQQQYPQKQQQQQQQPKQTQHSTPPFYYRTDTPPTTSTRDSPPLDMLASLADRQYQKDFKQEPTEKSLTLPPLNPWRYDQRPTLPT